MGTPNPVFRHECIDPDPPGRLHDVTLLGDIDGDGGPEIVIAGKSGEVFWYDGPDWERTVIAHVPELEAGVFAFGGAVVAGAGKNELIH